MSEESPGLQAVSAGLGKGCLVGLGLAVLFLVIGGVLYLLLSLTGLAQNLTLLIAIAGGPILGTSAALIIFWQRAMQVVP